MDRSARRTARRSVCAATLLLASGFAPAVLAHEVSHHGAAAMPAAISAASPDAAALLAGNAAAMIKMMADMETPPTGDVDRDFVAMMIPHHQGALDMAVLLLRYGRNAQLKRLAQEIIVTQQQEIAAMRLAIGDPLPSSSAAPPGAASKP